MLNARVKENLMNSILSLTEIGEEYSSFELAIELRKTYRINIGLSAGRVSQLLYQLVNLGYFVREVKSRNKLKYRRVKCA